MKSLSLVKGNLVNKICITLGLGFVIGTISLIVYNLVVLGVNSSI